jgi:hypothetical protein
MPNEALVPVVHMFVNNKGKATSTYTSCLTLCTVVMPHSPLSFCRYKYLVHVDGQGLSSRLDQLLPLGSLVLKEESGYTTYYHHLLK